MLPNTTAVYLTDKNENKHTPGPWFTEQHVDRNTLWIGTAEDYIGEIYKASPGFSISEAQAQANARLIAASPCLLEALEAYVTHFGDAMSDIELELKEKALTAISRARGQQ